MAWIAIFAFPLHTLVEYSTRHRLISSPRHMPGHLLQHWDGNVDFGSSHLHRLAYTAVGFCFFTAVDSPRLVAFVRTIVLILLFHFSFPY